MSVFGLWENVHSSLETDISICITDFLFMPNTQLKKIDFGMIWFILLATHGKFQVVSTQRPIHLTDILSAYTDESGFSKDNLYCLTRIFHDVFKNDYLVGGQTGLKKLTEGYPRWLELWDQAESTDEDLFAERLNELKRDLDDYLNGELGQPFIIKQVGRICGEISSYVDVLKEV